MWNIRSKWFYVVFVRYLRNIISRETRLLVFVLSFSLNQQKQGFLMWSKLAWNPLVQFNQPVLNILSSCLSLRVLGCMCHHIQVVSNSNTISFKKLFMMDQQLRVLAALVKDLGWFPISTRLTCGPVTPVPGNNIPFWPPRALGTHICTKKHARKLIYS